MYPDDFSLVIQFSVVFVVASLAVGSTRGTWARFVTSRYRQPVLILKVDIGVVAIILSSGFMASDIVVEICQFCLREGSKECFQDVMASRLVGLSVKSSRSLK